MAATSVTENYDAVLTTTLRNMQPVLRDNISRSNKLINYLKETGRSRAVNGGERIKVALMYGLNSGADFYQGYGQLSSQPQDGITSAFFPWSQLAVPIIISGLEKRQNQGEAQVLDLLQSKTTQTQAEASAMELLNRAIVSGKLSSGATGNLNQFVALTGVKDTSAQAPLPLPALIDASPSRSVAIGAINGGTEAFWRNQALAATATTYAGFKKNRTTLYNRCAKGSMGNPDLILSDQLVWELYYNSLHALESYTVSSQRTIDILGGVAEDLIKFRGAVNIWDEVVPDVGTSTATAETENGAGDAVGTYLQSGAHGTEFHINTKALEFVYHPDAYFTTTPFQSTLVAGQDASIAYILFQGQLCVNNRRKLGVHYDIDNSIAA
jgi:hypothetical protein